MTEKKHAREDELKREMVRYGRWLYRLGFVPGTSGNLSVRLDGNRLLATPTGISKCMIRSADIVMVDLDGRQLAGSRKVTSEIGMHLAIYRQRQDVEAVIHSHPPIATAFACSGRALDEMFCQEAVMTLGSVPLAEYATTGTDEVADSLIPLISGHEAILLANHGAVTYGRSIFDAFQKMETLEHLAQIRLVSHQLGCARALEGEQAERLLRARERYLQNAM
ncbi:MAG TPA: class II aldolase/adducin family protein [Terracidiphilus sp.]|jgi:L-fuculose-phosphate aldolase